MRCLPLFGVGWLPVLALATPAPTQEVRLVDPIGDDHGPGTYTYPTDPVYTPGSFDLTGFTLTVEETRARISVSVDSILEDRWATGMGFAVQMVFVFIDRDGAAGSGHTEGIPGLNITFDPEHAWEKCIILSPNDPWGCSPRSG